MTSKQWFVILTIGCILSVSFEGVRYSYNIFKESVTPIKISVDKVVKPIYPVGTFEYEVKRTQ